MDEAMNPLYILGVPLGYVMEWIYKLIPNYGWDIILFTLLINIVKIPLQLNQQKSMAKMSAYQPMIAEIQKKYKDKPDKQQEELLKLLCVHRTRALPFRLWGSRSHLQYLNIPPYYASGFFALICLYFQHSTLHGFFHSCTKETARQIRFRML